MILLLSTLALADDTLPARPPPPSPVPGECLRAIPIVAGQPLPVDLHPGGKAACGGVLLPSSDLADLLATEVWAREVDGTARILLSAKDVQIQSAEEQAAWWHAQALRPEPKIKPGVAIGVSVGAGLIVGVGLTVAGAYAVSLVAE